MKFIAQMLMVFMSLFMLSACTDAEVASRNLSKDADNFKIERRVIFYNGITGEYLLSIQGLCALEASEGRKVSITCKVNQTDYKKHYLGLSDNVTYFIEQLEPSKTSASRYKVIFKPSVILPDIELR